MLRGFITDVDGTLTDNRRRLSTAAVEEMRRLIDAGIPIILASGNTLCFLDTLSKMIGTDGNVIAENGGVYRKGFLSKKTVAGDHDLCLAAYQKIREELQPKGDELRPFSINLRYSDVAFSRDTTAEIARDIIKGMNIEVIDTGFAIHLHTPGITKGTAFQELAKELNMSTKDFLVTGDSRNDIPLFKLGGFSISPQNATDEAKKEVDRVMNKPFGEGVADALKEYFL